MIFRLFWLFGLLFLTYGRDWLEQVELTSPEEMLISSSGYPYDCPKSYLKQWDFSAPFGKQIMVTCTDLFFPKADNCQHGGMYVWDGEGTKRFCGVNKHLVVTSVGNKLKLRVRTASYSKGRIHCFVKYVEKHKHLDSSEEDQDLSQPSSYPKPVSCDCGWTNQRTRIVGGKETSPNEFPYMVSILGARSRNRICGGSIISEYHVLTAAHCVHGPRRLKLVVSIGEHDITNSRCSNSTEFIEVAYQFPHEMFDPKSVENDIAVLYLAKKVPFRREVGPVCLPPVKLNLLNQQIKALGWGDTKTNEVVRGLRQVDLKVVDILTCSERYKYAINTKKVTQLCTYSRGKDTCQGDSGGPLIYMDPETNRYTQVALVSYGKSCASTTPAVNTDVQFFMPWIEKIVQATSKSNVCKKVVND